jgi:hypothetical protein
MIFLEWQPAGTSNEFGYTFPHTEVTVTMSRQGMKVFQVITHRNHSQYRHVEDTTSEMTRHGHIYDYIQH